jgi:glycosyltransferase involved in cell wall biosynthesis
MPPHVDDISDPGARPALSVVLASCNAAHSIEECITELLRQAAGSDVEIIVVDNSTDGSTDRLLSMASGTSLVVVQKPPDLRIPELWAEGIRQADGRIAALTTAHFVPRPDWMMTILDRHASSVGGVGGAIEPGDELRLTDAAVYFTRYARYMLPFPRISTHDVAADNASYSLDALDQVRPTWESGFWEPEVHRALLDEGYSLTLDPSVVVSFRRSFGFRSFILNRLDHGRAHGSSRVRTADAAERMRLTVLSPLVPFIMTARTALHVARKRRRIVQFLLSLPLVFLFYTSWALGETMGYWRKR